MSTVIIAVLVALAVVGGIRYSIKQKGSCGDCDCACPVKTEMHNSKTIERKVL